MEHRIREKRRYDSVPYVSRNNHWRENAGSVQEAGGKQTPSFFQREVYNYGSKGDFDQIQE